MAADGSIKISTELDTDKLKSSMDSLGNIVKKGSDVMIGALAAGAAAFTGLALKSLDMVGELEQNMGGAEAVFGDFADKAKSASETAFKTAGIAASDYLATINKMGALMMGSGIEQERALDLSSAAMQRAADVASIMGIDTSAAMESIAGAAKGNFTMMDNLGVAMNATSIEAYALSKGIETSYKDMDQATKIGLAMEMFLEKTAYAAGNYSKENETLAGSLATAKAAFSNFMAGIGSTDDVVEAFSNAADVILRNVTELLPRLAEGLGQVLAGIAPKIPELVKGLLPAIVQGAVALLEGLLVALPGIISVLIEVIPMIAQTILQMLPTLADTGKQILSALVNGLVTAFPEAQPVLQKINELFDKTFGELFRVLSERFSEFAGTIDMGEVLDVLGAAFSGLIDILLILADTIMPPLIAALTWFFENLETLTPILIAVAAGFAAFEIISTIVPMFAALQGMITTISAAIAAAGGVIPALGAALAALASPVVIVTAAIAALVAGFVYLFQTNEEFREKMIAIWESIQESVSTIIESVKEIFTGFIDHLSDTGVFDRVKELWSASWDAIMTALDAIWTAIATLADAIFGGIADFFEENSEAITDMLTEAWDFIWGFIEPIWNTINEIAQKIFGDIKKFFEKWGPEIREIFSNTFQLVFEVVKKIFDNLKQFWDTWGPTIMAFFKLFLDNLKSAFELVWNQIKTIVELVINTISGIIKFVLAIIQGDWEGAWNAIKQVFEGIWEAIKSTVQNILDFITDIFGNIRDFLGNIDLLDIGKNIIQSLINGITSMGGAIWDAVTGIGNSIADGIKGALGIASPSKVGIAIGKNFSLSVAQGLDDEADAVDKSIRNLADGMQGFESGVSSNLNLGNGKISIDKLTGMTNGNSISSTTNNVDRGIIVHFYNDAPINDDMDLKMLAQKFGNFLVMEERSRGLVTT